MAIERTMVIKTDTKSSQKEVKELEKAVEGVNKEVKETTGSTEAMGGALDNVTGGAITKFKAFTGTLKGVTSGFKTMRLAIISTGLGALVVIIGSLIAAFSGSEEGQNKFAKLTTIIGAAVGNLVDLLADLGENLISAFENPQKALKDFTKLIKDNLINRFEGLLELVPKLGKAVSLLFEGEFSRAGKVAADAVGKVTLGVDSITDSFESAKEGVKGFIKEQQKELKQAASVADMRAKADKIERKLIVDRSKLESEIANLRLKSRQEEEFSAAERKQALLDAQVLEDQLLDKETEFLELRRDAQILENTFSRSNKENLTKEAEAIAAVNRQQASRANTARQVQREVNTISKQIEAENKRIANEEAARKKEEETIELTRLQAIQKIKDDFKIKQQDLDAQNEEQKINLEELRTLSELDRLNATEEQKTQIIQFYEKKRLSNAKLINEAKLKSQLEFVSAMGNAIGALGSLFDEGTAASKGAALMEIIIKTGVGFAQGLDIAQKSAAATGPAAAFAFPIFYAQQIASVLGAVGQARTILKKVKTKGGGGASASTSSGGAVPTPPPAPPSFNIVGASDTNQLADAIGGQTQQPVQAFVVANDVTTAQSLENNIVEGATLG